MKTEKEKMLAGELYNAGDRELIARWHEAKQLMRAYDPMVTETEKVHQSAHLVTVPLPFLMRPPRKNL